MSQLIETAAEAETVTVTLKRIRCRHVHADARKCGSPALRNEQFCYFHHTTRPRKPKAGKFRHLDAHEPFELPVVEDLPSALSVAAQILCRIASNDLDPTRAGRMLYNLQIITTLLDRAERAAKQKPGAQPVPPADLVEQLIDDETHGPIAPIVEYTPPPPAAPQTELTGQPALSASTEPTRPPFNPETASAQSPFNGAPRFYTEGEQWYLCLRGMKGEELSPGSRPLSLSQQEVDEYLTYRRARINFEEAAKNPRRKKKGLTLQATAGCPTHDSSTVMRGVHSSPLESGALSIRFNSKIKTVILSEGVADAAAEGPAVRLAPPQFPQPFHQSGAPFMTVPPS